MNKSLMSGIGIGVVVAAAAGAVANLSMKDTSTAGVVESPAAIEQMVEADVTSGPLVTAAPVAAVTALTRAPAKAPARTSADVAQRVSYARVVSATPVVETERVAREVCRDEQVVRQKPVQDEKRVAGAALGAIVGGVLGNQVGDGDGQKLATAAGAVAGGVAGSKIQKRVQQGNTETVTERRCETVYDMKEKTVGWDVRYRIGEQVQSVRMDSNPGVGTQLPLRNGRLTAQTVAQGRGTT